MDKDCLGQAWQSGEEPYKVMMEMTFISRIHRYSHLFAPPPMPDGPTSDEWTYQENVASLTWCEGALINSLEVGCQHLLLPIFPI